VQEALPGYGSGYDGLPLDDESYDSEDEEYEDDEEFDDEYEAEVEEDQIGNVIEPAPRRR
ncbi:MAG: hypothetical protein ACKOCK_01355, partial [Chloroflexota bacterium]